MNQNFLQCLSQLEESENYNNSVVCLILPFSLTHIAD